MWHLGSFCRLIQQTLSKSVINQQGDFIFIPEGVPHQPVNLSSTEEAIALVSRNDPDEQESVQVYNLDYAE